jgi:hypothetical protein
MKSTTPAGYPAITIALTLLILIASGTLPDSASAALTGGLISYWTFDEGSGTVAADIVGGFNGTLMNGPVWVTGKFGSALDFDGTDDYVLCAERVGSNPGIYPAELMPQSAFSCAAWVKVEDFGYYGGIIGNGLDVSSDESGFYWYTGGTIGPTPTNFGLFIESIGSPQTNYIETPQGYLTNTWYHVAVTYDGPAKAVKHYVNGSLVTGGPGTTGGGDIKWISTVSGNYPQRFTIGKWHHEYWNLHFTGTIDDVGYWNRALTHFEIAWLSSCKISDGAWFIKPTPETRATLVPVEQVLSWTEPSAGTQTGYDVYFGTDPDFITNPKVITNQLVTSYDPPGDLAYETTYYWRVDIHDPNNGGPIIRIGPWWRFETIRLKPYVTQDPQDVTVAAGGTAVFTVAGLDIVSYQWYKTPDPVNNTPGDDTAVGGNSDTLTINNVQLANDGYYFCKLTNVYGSTSSNVARLRTKPILTVKTEPNSISTVTPPVGQHEYYRGSIITIVAWLSPDCPYVYYFQHWLGDVADANSASTTVLMEDNKTVTAIFAVGERVCGDLCHPILQGDLNRDCYINFEDFALYCQQWLACTHPDCD